MPKGHHVDPKQCPLALNLGTVDSLVDSGKNNHSEGQFSCCALEVPLKGKRWEFAQLEKSSKVPIHIQGNPDKICLNCVLPNVLPLGCPQGQVPYLS